MQTGSIISTLLLSAAVFAVIYYLCCGRKLSGRYLFAFSAKLSGYLNAGMPLNEAFRELMQEFSAEPYPFRYCLELVKSDLSKGASLSEALEKRKDFFPGYYVKMIAIGEKTDTLPQTLAQLSKLQQALSEKSMQVRNSLAYPVIVLILLITGALFVSDFIVPSYTDIYETLHIDMPDIMIVFAFIAGKAGTILTVLLLAAAGTVGWYMLNRERYRTQVEAIIFRIPVLGRLRQYFDYILIAGTGAFMTTREMPSDRVIAMMSEVCTNQIFRERLLEASKIQTQGITDKLREAGIFSHSFLWLASQGENAGALPESMDLIRSCYSDELNIQAEKLAKFTEITLVLVAGFITGIIAFGLFLPFLSLSAKVIQNIVVF
ncbi:MAG: type II secretion system F family protein [Firmicutes bacterium]|nr:type II secretion system F family protein [Bacillota bacterium]